MTMSQVAEPPELVKSDVRPLLPIKRTAQRLRKWPWHWKRDGNPMGSTTLIFIRVADFQIAFQVIFDSQWMPGQTTGYVEWFGMKKEFHLLDRQALDLLTQPIHLAQNRWGYLRVELTDTTPDDRPKEDLGIWRDYMG